MRDTILLALLLVIASVPIASAVVLERTDPTTAEQKGRRPTVK